MSGTRRDGAAAVAREAGSGGGREEARQHGRSAEGGTGAMTRRGGLRFSRRYTSQGIDPLDAVTWDRRDASITNEKGEVVFEQKGVEVPAFWSPTATNVVVSKYFRGGLGRPDRETSVRQVIQRVSGTIAGWGRQGGYFASETDAQTFEDELTCLLVNQHAAFNSPVWFNVGIEEHPQCSACFINSVSDSMDSIMQLAAVEAHLFKGGSGTGSNLSALRSSREPLSSGGRASGPVSFMRGYDAFAGIIRSGGKTRRAAKMVILNADHPDVLEFIRCKATEEKKAWTLIDAGYDGSLNGEAYASIFFQNSNNSVRATDDFMQAVVDDGEWHTRWVKTREFADTYRARDVMKEIAGCAHLCGDPGMQFDTTINKWHTCPQSGRINASNPCSEYMFVDDSACNLASLNLMRFLDENGAFDIEGFRHAIDILITAQEIIVEPARYPTDQITDNSHRFRSLGLGYANLGALLMARGLPYDSDEGRAFAASITALMTGESYAHSARVASRLGAFADFEPNRADMLRVVDQHREALGQIAPALAPSTILAAAREVWDEAKTLGAAHGFRNAQVTVLAPTGTIAFMMDCDTTGVEPDIALVKYKHLVGGGRIKIINQTVPAALRRLGYGDDDVRRITDFLEREGTIEGAPGLKAEHLPVFDCAFKPLKGERSITAMGHVKMMAAVQPFISGAISKTVNLPHDTTPEEIAQVYVDAWQLGLKAIAVYREGSKRTQPLSLGKDKGAEAVVDAVLEAKAVAAPRSFRHRLPDERQSITHKFAIANHEGYITVGMYEDGSPGEIFVKMAKEGATLSGLMDSFALALSLALQYGVPLKVLVEKFSHTRFEPSGFTPNPEIPYAKSIMDYMFRWLGRKFLPPEDAAVGASSTDQVPLPLDGSSLTPTQSERQLTLGRFDSVAPPPPPSREGEHKTYVAQADAPFCSNCGDMMVRCGSCYRCFSCGDTSGCS
ncbi:MAG: vitamin B12-dependent ribonucleotide reductase [Deltaproteobacteria bacterium]|nr:vitamin B12-dependent ribonucleotide reductase [Deltaproteobacteria bacterium]